MTEYFDLKGQVALVTGCSAGLGFKWLRPWLVKALILWP